MTKNPKFISLLTTLILCYLACVGCKGKNKEFRIGVLQWTEKIHAYNQTYKGVLDALEDKGYKQGITLEIDYKNVEQDKELALKTALEFVNKGVDLIVCGTCLDYYGKIDELAVGRVSNMLDILQSMKDAQKVLNF